MRKDVKTVRGNATTSIELAALTPFEMFHHTSIWWRTVLLVFTIKLSIYMNSLHP